MIERTIREEDIAIVNICAPKLVALKYIREILKTIKEEIYSNTILVGDFNTPLTQWTNHPDRKLTKKHKV